MKYTRAVFMLVATLSSAQSIAGIMEPIVATQRWVSTLTIGADFVNPGQTQTLMLLPPFQNTYTKGNNSQTLTDAGGFVGIEREFNDKLSVQLGVSGYIDEQITLKGSIWQFTLPEFDDLNYKYHIRHARVMATTKLLTTIPQYSQIHPYLSGEIGTAFNHTSDYHETPLETGILPTAPFANHNQTSFAWGIGLGLDYNLNQHVRLGVGYQFSDLGRAALGPTSAALTTQTLNLSHIYVNQLRFQLTILM